MMQSCYCPCPCDTAGQKSSDTAAQSSDPRDTDPPAAYVPTRHPEVAQWIMLEHQTPFLLCVSLYSWPLRSLADHFMLSEHKSERVVVWKNGNGAYFIGFKGTSTALDVADDALISGFVRFKGDVSLVAEGQRVLDELVGRFGVPPQKIMLGGHSLGGYAAMVLAARFRCRAVSFNGAAPASAPLTIGPGPGLGVHYHIAGDLVSTHVAPQTATVIRINKLFTFGFYAPHILERFYAKDAMYGTMTGDEEDSALVAWAYTALLPAGVAQFVLNLVLSSPIPGTARASNSATWNTLVQIGGNAYNFFFGAPGRLIATLAGAAVSPAQIRSKGATDVVV